MIIHPRSSWQTRLEPVTGPALVWADIDEVVIHYPGADWADLDFDNDGTISDADSIWLLRAMQHAYLTDPKRGYSLGYGWLVDPQGHVWEIRGATYRNAANKGRTGIANRTTVSVIVIVDDQDPANLAQIAALNELLAHLDELAGHELDTVRHGDLDATACPGAGITAQIHAGLVRPARPTAPPTDSKEDSDMPKYLHVSSPGNPEIIYALDGAGATVVGFSSPQDRNVIVAALGAVPVEVSTAQYAELIARAG